MEISNGICHWASDPLSPIIGNACHSLHWVTNLRLVDLIDVTLACKDTSSKLVRAVTVADVNDEGCCRFMTWGFVIKLNFCPDFEHKVCSRFQSWGWSLVSILLLRFGWGYEVESWVKILKLGLVNILNLVEILMFFIFWSWCFIQILKMKFDQDLS